MNDRRMSMRPLESRMRFTGRLTIAAAALLTLVGGTAAAAAPAARNLPHPATAATTLTWHPFTLINGWQSASQKELVTGKPEWAFRNGVVYFRGAIKQPNP